mmetsp:Transcript_5512/g.22525  ORF Transcript_5512/g.22525 Transcript_5512/m.22525 type:complete len:394 (-) Transcript_5512:9-1190(-)
MCFNGRAIVLSVIVSLARGVYSTGLASWQFLPGELQLAVNHPLSARSLAHRRGHVLRVSRRRRLGHDLNGASSGYDDRPELQILCPSGAAQALPLLDHEVDHHAERDDPEEGDGQHPPPCISRVAQTINGFFSVALVVYGKDARDATLPPPVSSWEHIPDALEPYAELREQSDQHVIALAQLLRRRSRRLRVVAPLHLGRRSLRGDLELIAVPVAVPVPVAVAVPVAVPVPVALFGVHVDIRAGRGRGFARGLDVGLDQRAQHRAQDEHRRHLHRVDLTLVRLLQRPEVGHRPVPSNVRDALRAAVVVTREQRARVGAELRGCGRARAVVEHGRRVVGHRGAIIVGEDGGGSAGWRSREARAGDDPRRRRGRGREEGRRGEAEGGRRGHLRGA